MNLVKVEFHVRGVVPCIMHNGQLADPLNKFARELKEKTSKKSKMTDEDRIAAFEVEFLGGLYVNEKGHPCWPGENIEGMIRSAARLSRKGKDVERGVQSDGDWPLIYDGPKTPEELWEIEHHRLIKTVVINKNRVLRCRPIFPDWELKFQVDYDPNHVDNLDTLKRWVEIAGRDVGLSDWRPKYGRFEVLSVSEVL